MPKNLINILSQADFTKVKDEAELESLIRKHVKNYAFKNLKKNPMIVPIVMVA